MRSVSELSICAVVYVVVPMLVPRTDSLWQLFRVLITRKADAASLAFFLHFYCLFMGGFFSHIKFKIIIINFPPKSPHWNSNWNYAHILILMQLILYNINSSTHEYKFFYFFSDGDLHPSTQYYHLFHIGSIFLLSTFKNFLA